MSFIRRLLAADEKSPAGAAGNPWATAAAEAPATEHASLHDGFDAARRRGSLGGAVWMWAKRLAVAMLLISGFVQLVIRPVVNWTSSDKAGETTHKQVSLQAAGATAASFAVDYLTSGGPTWEPQRTAALSQWLYSETFAGSDQLGAWEGEAVMHADSPSVVGTQRVGDDGAVVAVQIRVLTFVPGGGEIAEADPPPAGESSQEAFRPPVPSGYVAGPAYWLRLTVPVLSDDGEMYVTAPGPVFSADDLTPIPPISEVDSPASDTLRENAETLFAAYASADLEYVAADGSGLRGMGGAMTVASVEEVDVAKARNSGGTVNASAKIQWQLAGTDLRISQTYGLRLVKATSDAPQIDHISVIEPRKPQTD